MMAWVELLSVAYMAAFFAFVRVPDATNGDRVLFCVIPFIALMFLSADALNRLGWVQ